MTILRPMLSKITDTLVRRRYLSRGNYLKCMSTWGNESPLKKPATLHLEDGTELKGYSFGSEESVNGEVSMILLLCSN